MPEGQEKPPKVGTFFFFFFFARQSPEDSKEKIPGGGNSRYEGLEVPVNRGV